MADDNARKELFRVIDEKAFQPVLNANPEDYDKEQRKKLKREQSTTKSTRKNYQKEDTAEGLYDAYKNDLSSDAAHEVQQNLRDLGLPTLPDIEKEIDRKAKELGVS